MARWRLRTAHYLNVSGTEWEREEMIDNGRKKIKHRFKVPMYLNPEDPADHNSPEGIIVADKPSRLYPRDIIFEGPPTPDMEPLDEEADEISLGMKKKWEIPADNVGVL